MVKGAGGSVEKEGVFRKSKRVERERWRTKGEEEEEVKGEEEEEVKGEGSS